MWKCSEITFRFLIIHIYFKSKSEDIPREELLDIWNRVAEVKQFSQVLK